MYNLLDEHLRLIMDYKEDWGEEGVTKVYNKYFADRYSREEFDVALEKRLSNIKEFTEIKQMEYDAITHHADPAYESNKKHFKAEEDPLPSPLQKYFKRVVRITRLREVKVLIGFTRVDASDPDADADDQPNIVTISKGKGEKWLPAAVVNALPFPADFDFEKHLQTSFRMFGTKYTTVDLICANDLMDAILDKFGKDVTTYAYDMENFRVETDVVPGTVFYSWVFGFGGKVVINGPTDVKEQYKELVLKAAEGL